MIFGRRKLSEIYSIGNGRVVWRILISENNSLIVEERHSVTREVFYSFYELSTGKEILKDFQVEGEKFWTGIEEVDNDVIFFHKFVKPDMPIHKGITAFNFKKKEILWRDTEANFLFKSKDELFCFNQKFESKYFYSLSASTGKFLQDYGEDATKINVLRQISSQTRNFDSYRFPEQLLDFTSGILPQAISEIIVAAYPVGYLDYIIFGDYFLAGYNRNNGEGGIENRFLIFDSKKTKIVLDKYVAKNNIGLIADAFFIKDSLLILIIEKSIIEVYNLEKNL